MTINEKDKIVKVCKVHGELTIERTYSLKKKYGYIQLICKECHQKICSKRPQDYIKKWRLNNKEKVKIVRKKWEEKNPNYLKEWNKKHKGRTKKYDYYYIQLILKNSILSREDIPKELIELTKLRLQYKRKIKEIYG